MIATIHNFKLGMLPVLLEAGEPATINNVIYKGQKLADVINNNQPVFAAFKKKQDELIDKYCAFDTDGNVIVQGGEYCFDEQEDKRLFLEALDKLLNEQVELNL